MASAAKPLHDGCINCIVQPGHTRNPDGRRVENPLASHDGQPGLGVLVATLSGLLPGGKQGKDLRREGRAAGIAAERIVDPEEELLLRKVHGPSPSPALVQRSGLVVGSLRREERHLEIQDLLRLVGGERLQTFSMAGCRIDRLLDQILGERSGVAFHILAQLRGRPT